MVETLFQFTIGKVTIGMYKHFSQWGKETLPREEGVIYGFGKVFIWKR